MNTSNYEIFKDIHGNRKVNKGHVQKLADAIERRNLLPYFPVLVNEDMEVIDGQHRLCAAMKLGYEVHYEVVPGLKIEDVMQINTNSKSWSMKDFIESWIVLDKSAYQILKDFYETYSMNPSVAASLLQGYNQFRNGHNISEVVRSGEFKVVSQSYAEKVASQLTQLKKYCDFDPMKDREFIMGLMRLNTNDNFDFDRLLAKLKLHDLKIEKRPSEKYYIILIEELYNFRNSNITELYQSSYEKTHKAS